MTKKQLNLGKHESELNCITIGRSPRVGIYWQKNGQVRVDTFKVFYLLVQGTKICRYGLSFHLYLLYLPIEFSK